MKYGHLKLSVVFVLETLTLEDTCPIRINALEPCRNLKTQKITCRCHVGFK